MPSAGKSEGGSKWNKHCGVNSIRLERAFIVFLWQIVVNAFSQNDGFEHRYYLFVLVWPILSLAYTKFIPKMLLLTNLSLIFQYDPLYSILNRLG